MGDVHVGVAHRVYTAGTGNNMPPVQLVLHAFTTRTHPRPPGPHSHRYQRETAATGTMAWKLVEQPRPPRYAVIVLDAVRMQRATVNHLLLPLPTRLVE